MSFGGEMEVKSTRPLWWGDWRIPLVESGLQTAVLLTLDTQFMGVLALLERVVLDPLTQAGVLRRHGSQLC